MSDAIEALSEYKYLLESMGHDAQSTGPYIRCLDAIKALQAMQGDIPNIIIGDGSEIQIRPAVPDDVVRAAFIAGFRYCAMEWTDRDDLYSDVHSQAFCKGMEKILKAKSLLSAGKEK